PYSQTHTYLHFLPFSSSSNLNSLINNNNKKAPNFFTHLLPLFFLLAKMDTRMQNINTQFQNSTDIGSCLSNLILSTTTNTLDSIFSDIPSSNTTNTTTNNNNFLGCSNFEPLGSSVYLRQRDILQKFYEETRLTPSFIPSSFSN
ncbi:hypothetical protein KIW84_025419, partial [Lathyrus oleraceus]